MDHRDHDDDHADNNYNDDDSVNVNHDKSLSAHFWLGNNKSVQEEISRWHLKLISNFSKAANKSLPGLVKTNANVCPDFIPLFWYFSTVGKFFWGAVVLW